MRGHPSASSGLSGGEYSPVVRAVDPTRLGGQIAVLLGIFHLAANVVDYAGELGEILDRGVWNSLTPNPTADELPQALAFWITFGSFGVPLLLLGAYVAWAAGRGVRVPAALGWGLAGWAAASGVLLSRSPFWLGLVPAALVVVGDRRRRAVTEVAR